VAKSLERRLADLERRVERLEGSGAAPAPAPPNAPTATGLSLVEQLRAQGGGLAYAGAVVRDGSEFLWIRQHDVEEVRGADPATIATVLIHQPKRGRYEIAAQTVVPLLTILAAAGDIGVLQS
jgi:hypothetical protein